ncbi:TPA: WYL domain-containing protein [Candidatus Scatousia excrementigallinarum]|uniref:WYL domain-containing protein n=1 Tax=Candidatus Scatousia excrementigallinarum TaxID=2840935 RepID=A0A9D1JPT4_9BACT|nr:WYL domain-containing protein [Candidatus Scatousia excrementigallinarum]
MKEFMKNKTVTYNLMSFTGFKSLVVFSLLLESPKSYDEINTYFKKHEYIKEPISIDTLRVYLTSLRMVGCEIIRTRKTEGSKYKLVSHPFELQITDEQIKSLIKVYKTVSKNIELHELLMLEKFLRKISDLIKNPDLSAALDRVSLFCGIDPNLVEKLIRHCNNKDQITFLYNSPRSGEKSIEIITDKVELNNNKFYLYGTGLEYNQYGYFPISRIKAILNVKIFKTDVTNIEKFTVGYELRANPNEIKLTDEEKLVEIKDGKLLIENTTSNPFIVKQRILSFGYACKVLYPESFKKDIISTLKEMREGYNDG